MIQITSVLYLSKKTFIFNLFFVFASINSCNFLDAAAPNGGIVTGKEHKKHGKRDGKKHRGGSRNKNKQSKNKVAQIIPRETQVASFAWPPGVPQPQAELATIQGQSGKPLTPQSPRTRNAIKRPRSPRPQSLTAEQAPPPPYSIHPAPGHASLAKYYEYNPFLDNVLYPLFAEYYKQQAKNVPHTSETQTPNCDLSFLDDYVCEQPNADLSFIDQYCENDTPAFTPEEIEATKRKYLLWITSHQNN